MSLELSSRLTLLVLTSVGISDRKLWVHISNFMILELLSFFTFKGSLFLSGNNSSLIQQKNSTIYRYLTEKQH